MKGSRGLVLLMSCAATGFHAHAQIYMCTDAAGRTLTSDRAIPECAARPMRELDAQGNVRREIPAPLTASQKRELQFLREQERQRQAAEIEQRREDRAIRTRYASEDDIEKERQRLLAPLEDRLRKEEVALLAADSARNASPPGSDAARKTGAPLAQQIKKEETDVAAIRRQVREHEAERDRINARFDSTLRRFRELAVRDPR